MESKFNFLRLGLAVLGFPIIVVLILNFSNYEIPSFQNLVERPRLITFIFIFAFFSFVINFLNLMVQIRKLKLSSSKIEAKYPFPVFDGTIRLSDLDYFIVVVADNKKNYENIWLVKEKKVVMIISSQFYKNFDEMKNYLSNHLKYENRVNVNFLDNYLAKFNFAISKLP